MISYDEINSRVFELGYEKRQSQLKANKRGQIFVEKAGQKIGLQRRNRGESLFRPLISPTKNKVEKYKSRDGRKRREKGGSPSGR